MNQLAKTNNGIMMKTRFFALAIIGAALAACSSAPSSPTATQQEPLTSYDEIRQRPSTPINRQALEFNPATAKSEDVELWLQQAMSLDPEAAQELQLRAAEVLLRDGEMGRADDTVRDLVAPELTPNQALRLALVRARIHRAHAEFSEALIQLSDPLVEQAMLEAPLRRQLQFSQLRASLFAIEGDHLAAVREWIFIDPLLTPSQQEQNRDAIWQSLMQIPTSVLLDKLDSASNRDYLGWLELASVAKDNQGDIEAQIRQRDTWLARWPNHPGRHPLPGGLDQLDSLIVDQPTKLALILPFTGRFASYGKAIRDGFIAAYMQAQENQARTPEIILYDSGSGDINRLLDQAISDGCELAIGPLRKEKLDELISQHPKMMPIPTLALNRIEGDQFPSGLYQFGLNPQDEAEQIADIARNKGLQRAMIITPEGNWGSKVAQAFAQRWQQAGGYISDSTNFNAKSNDYSKRIKQLLHIDQSEQRRRRLQQIIGMTPYFEPYRRSDADMIFLVARPNEGRAVKPLLAYHYAGDLPVYATSHIYRGNTDRSRDQDINGIHFVDIPWVFNSDSAIRQAINAHFARSDAFQRMYALGIDSFRLHMRINQLRTGSGQVFGETGTLTLNALGQIERELTLAEIRGGVAVIDASSQE